MARALTLRLGRFAGMCELLLYERVELLGDRLASSFAKHAQSTALVHDGEVVSYRSLAARANRLARYLIAHGVGPETVVPIAFDPSVDRMVAILAVLFAGGAYLPLDTAAPASRNRALIEDSQARLLLTTRGLAGGLSAGVEQLVLLDSDEVAAATNALPETPVQQDERREPLLPHHLAYVIYTSGSTGLPKGVANIQSALAASVSWAAGELGLGGSDVVVHRVNYTFDVSIWEMLCVLSVGGLMVIPQAEAARDSVHIGELVRAHGATLLFFVPTTLWEFIESEGSADCPTLRNIAVLGEAFPGRLQQRAHERFPAATVWNGYGPTEAAIGVTLWKCRREDGGAGPPIGDPAADTQLHILDKTLQPVQPGEPGELFIAGAFLARGYLGRPELTAERFIPCPFGPDGGRMYRTGDVVERREDGRLYYLGRNDDQVKLNGIRVELGEIEAAVANLPGVARNVVIARNFDGENKLIAYMIMKSGCSPPSSAEAKAHLSSLLPISLTPSFFVAVDSFPLTASGKLRVQDLPGPDLTAQQAAFRSPVGELESFIACAFSRLLGVSNVGADDNFFDLGGTSLTAMRLAARIRARTGFPLPMRFLLENATPARLADVLLLLQAGERPQSKRASASRPVMFLLPGAGGFDLAFGAFEVACDATLDIRALHYPDWTQLCGRGVTFESLADQLTDEVISVAPDGDVDLVGYSMGGHLAFEIARRLAARGRRVGFLGIIDTDARRTGAAAEGLRLGLARRWKKLVRTTRDKELTLAIVNRFWAMAPAPVFPVLGRAASIGPVAWRERMEVRLLVAALIKLMRGWQGRVQNNARFKGPTYLFRVRPNGADEERFDGWWDRCSDVRTVYVDGRHLEIVAPEHLHGFVRAFLEAHRQSRGE